ncbi:hypothetical protein Bhyg_07210, partial [Pseudolycoriella hygida]
RANKLTITNELLDSEAPSVDSVPTNNHPFSSSKPVNQFDQVSFECQPSTKVYFTNLSMVSAKKSLMFDFT